MANNCFSLCSISMGHGQTCSTRVCLFGNDSFAILCVAEHWEGAEGGFGMGGGCGW